MKRLLCWLLDHRWCWRRARAAAGLDTHPGLPDWCERCGEVKA